MNVCPITAFPETRPRGPATAANQPRQGERPDAPWSDVRRSWAASQVLIPETKPQTTWFPGPFLGLSHLLHFKPRASGTLCKEQRPQSGHSRAGRRGQLPGSHGAWPLGPDGRALVRMNAWMGREGCGRRGDPVLGSTGRRLLRRPPHPLRPG